MHITPYKTEVAWNRHQLFRRESSRKIKARKYCVDELRMNWTRTVFVFESLCSTSSWQNKWCTGYSFGTECRISCGLHPCLQFIHRILPQCSQKLPDQQQKQPISVPCPSRCPSSATQYLRKLSASHSASNLQCHISLQSQAPKENVLT